MGDLRLSHQEEAQRSGQTKPATQGNSLLPSCFSMVAQGPCLQHISLASFHAYLADFADCENECFPFSWLIFACICSLI
uniref:Uncharacterized protein n=1 Tax=Cyanoderma ruficeps TaxID=181631 RepID=A0A8C3XFA4_9PASS